MRKLIWLIAGLLTIGISALVVAPTFIDWSQYKSLVQDEIRSITGRDLKISGRVQIALLPTPALIAEGITFTNIPGSHAPDMASLKALEAKVALGPLLSGKLKIESVKLAEPIIELERLADGRANWDITLSNKAAKKRTKETTSSHINIAQTPGAPMILLDNLTIENGTIIYRDAVTKTIETFKNINANARAATVQGPIETSGTMALRGAPLSFSMSLGQIIRNRTIPFSAKLSLQSDGLSAKIIGSVINLSHAPQFKGSINVKSEDARTTLLSLGAIPSAIAAPIPLDLSGQVAASTRVIDIKDLDVSLLNIQAKGDLQIDLDEKPRFSSQLAINQIDVDKLLSALDGEPANRQHQSSDPPKPLPTVLNQSKSDKIFKNTRKTIRFSLPNNIDGSAIITIDAINYKSEVTRDVLVNMELKDSALLLRQLSAQIPGESDISIQGQLITKKHIPNFSGSIIGTIGNLPDVMTWLSIPTLPVPADRLRQLNFKSQVSTTPEQIGLTRLDLSFDNSQLQGGITIALRKRPSLSIALTLDRFDADTYFSEGKVSKKLNKNKLFRKKVPKATTKSASQKTPIKHLNTLSMLNAFDANFNLRVKSAVLRGSPVKDVIAEGKLYNGILDLKRLSVGKLAGASARISGTLAELASIPEAQNIKFTAKIANLGRHIRIYGAKLRPILKRIVPISVNGRLNGNLLAPKLDAAASIASAAITYHGQISAIPFTDMLNGKITFKHANLPQFLHRLGYNYQPTGRIGGVDFTAEITGSSSALNLKKLKGRIGKTAIGGTLSAQFSHSKPFIKADLKTGALNLENFLPAQNKASFRTLTPRLLPASWQVPLKPTPNRTPLLHLTTIKKWPTKPLDLSALNNINADMALKAPLIIYHRYLFEKATITAKIRNGVLEIPRFNTNLFGGAVSGLAQATAKGNQISSSLRITNLDLEQALKINSQNPAVNGRMSIDVDVRTAGHSFSNMISALDGRANFAVTDITLDKVRHSPLLSGLLKHLVQPNPLGNKATITEASARGSFKITNGIATTHDLKLTSAVGNGKATGDIHLPNQTIDIDGQLALAENPLMKIFKAKVREASNVIPFTIKGPLKNPRVRVDTKAALNRGLRIPKADKILRKTPKELRTILKGILRGTLEKQ